MRRSCTPPRLGLGALALVCLVPAAARAQTSTEDRPAGALRGGDWALQFQIVENFTLTSFDGLMLSLERHTSPRSALRLSVDLGIGTADQDSRSDATDSLVTSVSTQERTEDSESVALKVQYASYSNPEGRLHFYWAVGPRVSYGRSHAERLTRTTRAAWTATARETTDGHTWGTALAGAIGIQWFAARGLGLLAEYGASAGYDFGRTTVVRTAEATGAAATRSSSEDERRGFLLDSLGVRFGVSVRF